jgi:phage repressor protein C with HTH and peptisase S24 domain
LPQKEFAQRLGIHKNTLARYERGERSPDAEVLLSIRALGVNPNWVLSGEDPMMLSDLQQMADDRSNEFSYITRWNIEVSAGHGAADPLNELKLEDIAFRNDWLEKQGLIKSNLAIFTARGDSMSPTIQHNDMLLIKTFSEWTRSESPDEGIYIIRLDGHLHAKRLQSDGRGGVLVKSDNTAYDTIHLEKSDLPGVDIIGKVVWLGRVLV